MAIQALPITALFAGVLGFFIALANCAVAVTRVSTNKFYGAENNSVVQFRSRGAGTLTEYTAVGLPFLALLEINKLLTPRALWWWGLVFTVSRLTHAVQLANPRAVPIAVRGAAFFTSMGLVVFAAVKLFSFAVRQ